MKEISFEGTWLKTKKEAASELEKKTRPFIGKFIWHLPLHKLQSIVQSYPDVENIQILRVWPNKFRVILLSDTPVLLLWGNQGLHPVTAKGALQKPLPQISTPDIPLLRGKIFFNQINLRKQAVQLFFHLPKKGLFSQNSISEIKYSKKDQGFYIYLINSPSPIRVGRSLSEFRPDRVESVLKYLQQKKIKWHVMDARFSQKIVVGLNSNF